MTFQIFLDQPEKLQTGFLAGETLTGEVQVQVNHAVRCHELRLSLGWKTSGSGQNEQSPQPNIQILFQGNWYGREIYRYPFAISIPIEGPFPFRGEEIHLFYALTATAKIPVAFDPAVQIQIPVLPQTRLPLLYCSGYAYLKPASVSKNFAEPPFHFIARVLLFYSAFVLLFTLPNQQFKTALGMIFGFTFLLVIGCFRNLGARYKITEPKMKLASNVFSPEACISFPLSFRIKRDILLQKVEARLVGEEFATKPIRNDQMTFQNEIFCVQKRYLEQTYLKAGEERFIQVELFVPKEAPYCFQGHSNQIRCWLQIEIHLAYWPNYRIVRPIYLLPQNYKALP